MVHEQSSRDDRDEGTFVPPAPGIGRGQRKLTTKRRRLCDDTAQNLVIRDVPQGTTLPKRKGGHGKGKAPMGSDLGG